MSTQMTAQEKRQLIIAVLRERGYEVERIDCREGYVTFKAERNIWILYFHKNISRVMLRFKLFGVLEQVAVKLTPSFTS